MVEFLSQLFWVLLYTWLSVMVFTLCAVTLLGIAILIYWIWFD